MKILLEKLLQGNLRDAVYEVDTALSCGPVTREAMIIMLVMYLYGDVEPNNTYMFYDPIKCRLKQVIEDLGAAMDAGTLPQTYSKGFDG